MSDPYYLRKANIDELDLSKYEKDYNPEELAAVKEALKMEQQRHQQEFDKLPFVERAKYHVGDLVQVAEQNPETLLAVPAAASLLAAGNAAVGAAPKAVEKTKQVFGSLRDMMSSKQEEGLLASQQAEKVAKATPAEVSAKATPTTDTPLTTEVGKRPAEMPLIEKSETTTGRKAVAKDVAAAEKAMAAGVAGGLPPPNLKTGTGKPAYEGQADTTKFRSVYATPTDVPKGYAFVPGAQYIDPVRGNVGQETFTKEFTNRPYPQTYKGTPESAIEVSNEINRGLNRPTRAQLIAEGKPLPENTKGITKEISKSKLVKVAGVGGALIALSDLANAQTPTEAALRGVDIATDYLPLVGQVKQAFSPLEAGMPKKQEEDIIAKKFKEASKLGSPYRSVPPPR